MLRGGRRAPVAGDEVEDGQHLLEHTVALSQHAPIMQWHPGALVLAVPALDLFMDALLDLALEDARAGRFVEVGYLEDVRCVDPVVGAPAHDVVATHIKLIDGDLPMTVSRVDSFMRSKTA